MGLIFAQRYNFFLIHANIYKKIKDDVFTVPNSKFIILNHLRGADT